MASFRREILQQIEQINAARSNAVGLVNAELINAYWGDKTVDELAAFIKAKYPTVKGYDRRGLYRMRKFYETYSVMAFVTTVLAQMQISVNEQPKIVTTLLSQFQRMDIRDPGYGNE
jgi:DUF1016 N-terminal domain